MEACGDVKSGTCNSDAPNIGAEYEIAIFDKDGNEKRRFGGKANCFVKGFLDMIRHYMINGHVVGGNTGSYVNVDGANVSVRYDNRGGCSAYWFLGLYPGGWRALASDQNATSGVVVGSGGRATSPTDFSLESKHSESVISHGGVFVGDMETVGNEMRFPVYRSFTNVGEIAVTIREIGLYLSSHGTSNIIMVLRDVVPEFDVLPGEIVIITYVIYFNGED
jgi:hypothetical protein